MRVRPTELGFKGILLLTALGVAFLAASYSNLFFLIITFCVVLGSLGLWWSVRHTRSVQVRLLDAPLAAAGAERQMRLGVVSDRAVAVFDITLAIVVDDTLVELAHVPLLRSEQRMTVALPGLSRGVATITTARCVSRFPFGIFRVTRHLPVALELVTFPTPTVANASHNHASANIEGNLTGGRSVEIAGLRPFRTGDSPADVHWKATARRGVPIVKERENGCHDVVEVVLDRRCDGAEVFEAALSRATARVLQAAENERPLQFLSQDYAVTIDAGRPIAPVLRWLASVEPMPLDAAPPRQRQEAVLA